MINSFKAWFVHPHNTWLATQKSKLKVHTQTNKYA